MKLTLQLPSSIEADIKYEANSRTVHLRPLYSSPSQPVGYISVLGDKGKTRSYRLSLNPRSGRVNIHEMLETNSVFDDASPSDSLPDDEAQE